MEVRNTFLLTTMHNSLLLKKKDSPNYKGKDLHGSYFHRERKNTLNALLKKPMVAYNQVKYAFICHLQSFCHSWGAWSICELCQFLQLIKSKSLLGSSEFSSSTIVSITLAYIARRCLDFWNSFVWKKSKKNSQWLMFFVNIINLHLPFIDNWYILLT